MHMARLLESRSLLADVMVRTRKRDAFPNKVQRVPWVLDVTLSKQEQQLYNQLSARIRKLAREQHAGMTAEFILIGRQRQLSSSIAALRSSGVSVTATAPRFSLRRCSFVVPGIGAIHGLRDSNHASAICAGVAFFRLAIFPSRSTRA